MHRVNSATAARYNPKASGTSGEDSFQRDTIRTLLYSVGFDVRTFGSAEEFLAADRPDTAGCLVLDVRLPGASGLDLQRHLGELNVPIPIVFITGYGDIPMSVRALKAGAVEFLTKPFRDQELLEAVHLATRRDRVQREQRAATAQVQSRYESLTSRERDVLALLIQGLVNKQIGGALRISEATVKLHRGRIMRKMGADSLVTLIWTIQKIHISPLNKRSVAAS